MQWDISIRLGKQDDYGDDFNKYYKLEFRWSKRSLYRVVLAIKTHIKYIVITFWNNFGFSLCNVPSVFHKITTWEIKQSPREVNSNNGISLKNTRDRVQLVIVIAIIIYISCSTGVCLLSDMCWGLFHLWLIINYILLYYHVVSVSTLCYSMLGY